MRQLLFSGVMTLLCLVCKAQEVELLGTYSASFIGAESIQFVGRDSFYFDGFYCTFGVSGRGRCAIRDNYLYLYFEKSKKKNDSSVFKQPVISRVLNDGDILTIDVTCIGIDEQPIAGATVSVECSGRPLIEGVADTSGKMHFRIRKNSFPVVIKTRAVGVEPGEIKLDQPVNYSAKFFLKENADLNQVLDKGQLYIYEIKELSPDIIIMRRPAGKGSFYKYRKRS